MKKVAVFGNAGGGKSTLAKALAQRTGLPLHVLDLICYEAGGGAVAPEVYAQRHARLLAQDAWIIEGYGSADTLWRRLRAADTLVYIDLPLALHCWWVTKRLLKGWFAPPEGWPERSPLWRSTLGSYRVLWLCHTRLTPEYRACVAAATDKRVFHLRSRADIARFLEGV